MLEALDLGKKIKKKKFIRLMPELAERLHKAQMASSETYLPVILLFEGWKTAGSGKILHDITASLDPRQFTVHPMRAARSHERKYPWMRRFWLTLPAYGEWGIYDHSWYWRVLTERVDSVTPEKEWRKAYRHIVNFERALTNDGYLIQKFFLHINKREQNRRLEKGRKKGDKPKAITAHDWEDHCRYADWMQAYEEMFEHTDTRWGPWTIVAAKNRRYASVTVIQTILNNLEERLDIAIETPASMQEKELEPLEKQAIHMDGETTEPVKETTVELNSAPEKFPGDHLDMEPIEAEVLVQEQTTA